MRKKSKGFTLIEIMAVIIILALIALIVTPLITGTIKNSKEELYNTQLDNIKSSARNFVVDLELEDGKSITLKLSDLKKEGLVDKEIKNPKTGELFDDCMEIVVTKKGDLYDYVINDEIVGGSCDTTGSVTMILIGSSRYQTEVDKKYEEPGVILKDNRGITLPLDDVLVNITKNGSTIATNVAYNDFISNTATYIDTSSVENIYRIEYKYEKSSPAQSKVREVSVVDMSALECVITPVAKSNSNGWITESSYVNVLSVNSRTPNKNLTFELVVDGVKKTQKGNSTFSVGKDGTLDLTGYVRDESGKVGVCYRTLKFETNKNYPSCNISLQGTKTASGWYTSNVTANLNISNVISPITGQDITLSSTKSYNGASSLNITNNGEKNIYGYIKDEALQEKNCVSSAKIDKTTNVSASITGTVGGNPYTSGSYTNQNVVLTATVKPGTTASGYTYQWYKDDVAIKGANSLTYTATTDGVYKFVATTGSGMTGSSNVITVLIDKTNPTVSYNVPSGVFPTDKSVKVTATDDHFDYMKVHVYKDGNKVTDKSVDKTTSKTFTVNLDSDGEWVIYTQAYDKAGNKQNQTPVDDAGSYYQIYTIDKTKPTATISVKDTDGNTITSGVLSSKDLKITFEKGGGATSIKYCIDTNNSCTPTTEYKNQITHSTAGKSYIRYIASKTVGGTEVKSTISSFELYLDKESVSCSISLLGEMGNNGWYTSDVVGTLTKQGTNFGMGTSSSPNYNSKTTFKVDTSSSAGQKIYGYVKSKVGARTATCPSASFKVDKVTPTIGDFQATTEDTTSRNEWQETVQKWDPNTQTYSDQTNPYFSEVVSTKVVFTVTATDDASGIDYYELWTNQTADSFNMYNMTENTSNRTLIGSNNTGIFETTNVNSSTYEYEIVVCDKAGNCSNKKISENCHQDTVSACTGNKYKISYSCDTSKYKYSVEASCVSSSSGSSGGSGQRNSGMVFVPRIAGEHGTSQGGVWVDVNDNTTVTEFTNSVIEGMKNYCNQNTEQC